MSSFRTTQAIVITRSGGAYINGTWEGEVLTDQTIIFGSLQPAKQIDIESLPEGRHENQNNVYRFYTDAFLTSFDTGQNSDILLIGGIEYEVLSSAKWQNGVINHNKYLLTKRGDRG
jgi:hypothetical protein